MSNIQYQDYPLCPVLLFTREGNVFTANGHHEEPFTTKFFTTIDVDKRNRCLTLRLLKKCTSCNEFVLIPTKRLITMDSDCVCGFHELSNVCIKHCNHPTINVKSRINGPFAIEQGYRKTVIWSSNICAENNGTIKLKVTEESATPLQLRVFNYLGGYKLYDLTSKKIYQFSFTDSPLIQIVRNEIEEKVAGEYEVISSNKWN